MHICNLGAGLEATATVPAAMMVGFGLFCYAIKQVTVRLRCAACRVSCTDRAVHVMPRHQARDCCVYAVCGVRCAVCGVSCTDRAVPVMY